MTDDLRTRIAAAIMQTCHGVYLDDAVTAADAMIRELGLREEQRRFDTLFANRDEPQHRYVTEWAADE